MYIHIIWKYNKMYRYAVRCDGCYLYCIIIQQRKKPLLPLYFPGDKVQYFGCRMSRTRDDDDGDNNNYTDNKNGETAVGRRTAGLWWIDDFNVRVVPSTSFYKM